MAHSSDVKANTVHSRANRLCLNCKRYFVPKNDLPKYVEGETTQSWCSKACYVILYPQVVEEIQCLYCPAMFVPKTKRSVMCGSEECQKKRKIEQRRKRREDPEVREKDNEYQRKRMEDPEVREKVKEKQRKQRANPEVREKLKEYNRKRREDPEVREKMKEYQRKRYEDPEFREKYNEYKRKRYHENKEKSDG